MRNKYFKLNCQLCAQQFNISEKQFHYENTHKISYRFINIHRDDTFIIDNQYESVFNTIHQLFENNQSIIKLAPYQWSPFNTIKNNLP